MTLVSRLASVGIASSLALCVIASACGSSKNFDNGDGGDATTDSPLFSPDTSLPDSLPACATGQYAAHPQPAALLVLLQRSGSMAQNNKWTFAAQAIVQALDANVFDSMTLGFMASPSSKVAGPACILNIPVACGVPAFPQVDLSLAGPLKSTANAGVRANIKAWLTNNAPDQSAGEGNPLYDGIQSGIGTLQGWTGPGKRILFVVTDGEISCTSLSSRTANAFSDGNSCPDWENPNNIMTLVNQANTNSTTPIDTFIVGVPGADTYDPTGVNDPPYHMRAALSDIAYAGSPANVPANCTHTNPFHPTTSSDSTIDPDPTTSCHFDMTQTYTSQQVADAIAQVRGQVLGCVFDLPTPEAGTVNLSEVNVSYAINGGSQDALYKRATPTEDCSQTGCWDYTATNQVELYGKACSDVMGATDADVEITVGCATIIK
jgi:hypothetical protein